MEESTAYEAGFPELPKQEVLALSEVEVEDYKNLVAILDSRNIAVSYGAIGHRVTYANLTEKDGWQTVGLAYTKSPEAFSYEVGKYWALKDAIDKLGSGRFYADIQNNPLTKSISDVVERLDG